MIRRLSRLSFSVIHSVELNLWPRSFQRLVMGYAEKLIGTNSWRIEVRCVLGYYVNAVFFKLYAYGSVESNWMDVNSCVGCDGRGDFDCGCGSFEESQSESSSVDEGRSLSGTNRNAIES